MLSDVFPSSEIICKGDYVSAFTERVYHNLLAFAVGNLLLSTARFL